MRVLNILLLCSISFASYAKNNLELNVVGYEDRAGGECTAKYPIKITKLELLSNTLEIFDEGKWEGPLSPFVRGTESDVDKMHHERHGADKERLKKLKKLKVLPGFDPFHKRKVIRFEYYSSHWWNKYNFLKTNDISWLKKKFREIEPTVACPEAFEKLKKPKGEEIKRIVDFSWNNCMNHAYSAKYPQIHFSETDPLYEKNGVVRKCEYPDL